MTDITVREDQPNDRWFSDRAQYVAGITCGHHDQNCDGPSGHWAVKIQAEEAGFDAHAFWVNYQDPAYRGFLLAVFSRPADLPDRASPIERLFWAAHLRLGLPELNGLVPQHPVARYRIDFALPGRKAGIELDGHASHSSPRAIAHDRKRQRDLEAGGWHIIRFGGSEVHRDADGCVRQAARLIRMRGAS